jgi:DnaT-like ssDNA binding protein
MPSVIVTTVGAANANSYVDVTAADNYFDDRLDAAVWTAAVTADKTRALLMAANRLQNENWLGNRVTSTQRLAWPRIDVAKVDPVGAAFGYGGRWGYGYQFSEVYKSDEIPQPVKDAQCELALAYLEGFDDGEEDAVDSFSADGVSVEFRASRPDGGLPPRVRQLIGGLIGGNRLVRG